VYTAIEGITVSGEFNLLFVRAETQISSQERRYFGGKRRKMVKHFILHMKNFVSKYEFVMYECTTVQSTIVVVDLF
jgi:hypothetical protein